MRRLMTFLMGVVTGGVLLFAALHYHVIRAQDGFHLVAKAQPQLPATYVDIRGFTVADWTKYPALLQALLQSDNKKLVDGATDDAIQGGIDRLLDRTQ